MSVNVYFSVLVLLVIGSSIDVKAQTPTDAECTKNLETDIAKSSICDAFKSLYQCLRKANIDNPHWPAIAERLKVNAKTQFGARGCTYNESALFGTEDSRSTETGGGGDTGSSEGNAGTGTEDYQAAVKEALNQCRKSVVFESSSQSETCRIGDQFFHCVYTTLSKKYDFSNFREDFEKSATGLYERWGCTFDPAKFFSNENAAGYRTVSYTVTLLSLSMFYIFSIL